MIIIVKILKKTNISQDNAVNLNELFRNPKLALSEGGNVSSQSPGWQGVPGEHQAQELDLGYEEFELGGEG